LNLQTLSSEDMYTLLQRQKIFVASETFADYVVATVIEQDAQGCRFRTAVTWQGKELTEPKEFVPVQGDAGLKPSKESILLYIEDARVKHADKCHKVRNRVRKEQQRKGRQALAVFAALLVIVVAVLIAGYPMLFKLVAPIPTPGPTPALLPSPALKLQYMAVRSTLDRDPQTGTTLTLSKDDVLTITVVDMETGATIAQEIVNLRVVK
jgi:hypothetical protein